VNVLARLVAMLEVRAFAHLGRTQPDLVEANDVVIH
jgi:hypothetical protein